MGLASVSSKPKFACTKLNKICRVWHIVIGYKVVLVLYGNIRLIGSIWLGGMIRPISI